MFRLLILTETGKSHASGSAVTMEHVSLFCQKIEPCSFETFLINTCQKNDLPPGEHTHA